MIHLRLYNNEDFSTVFRSENALFNQMTEEEFKSYYLDNESIDIYLIEGSDGVIGYAVIWQDLDKSQIYSMAIFEPYKRKGFGYQALMLLEILLKQKGVHEWSLEVRESNSKAIQLYQKMGFKKAAMRYNYYKNHENAHLMVKMI